MFFISLVTATEKLIPQLEEQSLGSKTKGEWNKTRESAQSSSSGSSSSSSGSSGESSSDSEDDDDDDDLIGPAVPKHLQANTEDSAKKEDQMKVTNRSKDNKGDDSSDLSDEDDKDDENKVSRFVYFYVRQFLIETLFLLK